MAGRASSKVEGSAARVGALRVARDLARSIEKGEYEPGQRLKEQELADKFGLSRAPIREALRLLQSQGLVVIEEMRGARVVRPGDDDFREIWLIRAALSGVVSELAAANPDQAAKQRFHDQTVALADKARAGAEAKEIYDGLRQNTRVLSELTLSTRAHSMLLGLAAGREAFQMRAIQAPERRLESTQTWVKLSEAVLKGDGPKAAVLMQTLYRNSMRFVTEEDAAGSEAASGKPKKR